MIKKVKWPPNSSVTIWLTYSSMVFFHWHHTGQTLSTINELCIEKNQNHFKSSNISGNWLKWRNPHQKNMHGYGLCKGISNPPNKNQVLGTYILGTWIFWVTKCRPHCWSTISDQSWVKVFVVRDSSDNRLTKDCQWASWWGTWEGILVWYWLPIKIQHIQNGCVGATLLFRHPIWSFLMKVSIIICFIH